MAVSLLSNSAHGGLLCLTRRAASPCDHSQLPCGAVTGSFSSSPPHSLPSTPPPPPPPPPPSPSVPCGRRRRRTTTSSTRAAASGYRCDDINNYLWTPWCKREMRSWSSAADGGADVAGLDRAGACTWLTGGTLQRLKPRGRSLLALEDSSSSWVVPSLGSSSSSSSSSFARRSTAGSDSAAVQGLVCNLGSQRPASLMAPGHRQTMAATAHESGVMAPTEEEERRAKTGASTLTVHCGKPSPLGVSLSKDVKGGGGIAVESVNFALFSEHATSVTLCLWLEGRGKYDQPSLELALDRQKNRSGNVWHVGLEGLPLQGVLYGYKVDGAGGWKTGLRWEKSKVLLDPYAKLVEGRRVFGDRSEKSAPFLGTYDLVSEPFDWGEEGYDGGGDQRARVPDKDTVIYEMNVRGFTADPSSGLEDGVRGSYRGVIEKIPHLVDLGVNCVELLPVYEFDEMEFQRRKNPRDHMVNTWGYSTVNFFAPMTRYASRGGGPVAAAKEFKEMVKALHAAGIEVILDVVYNHTNEADDQFPYTTSFRGIDNLVYYSVDVNNYVQLINLTGCGNTVNCNHPVVMELIMDSLRHWVQEYHVDGFRFDLATIMCRDSKGNLMDSPPVVRAIAKDPVLAKCKVIAEPWDLGAYQVGTFPNWDRWGEWNGKFRDDVRRFIKGDGGMKSVVATRIAGSADLYKVNQRKPYHSINYAVCHDGFSLHDVVSYNTKHNQANGEGGRDGQDDNFSWNCGAEGPSSDPGVLALRTRQMKNFLVILFMSQGTPMILMGDEYMHTRFGNNNSYGHDTKMNHFLWDELEKQKQVGGGGSNMLNFTRGMLRLRRTHPLLGRDNFLTSADIVWHENNWHDAESRFLAFSLHEGNHGQGAGDIYVAFNAHNFFVNAPLPGPRAGKRWFRVVDTNLGSGEDVKLEGAPAVSDKYNLAPYSSIVLLAKPA